MAKVQYNVIPGDTTGVGIEEFQSSDLALINNYKINTSFQDGDYIELHIYSQTGEKLNSIYNYNQQKQLLNSAPKDQNGPSVLYINPEQDIITYGFPQGDVKLLYHFLRVLSRSLYFIEEISADRTELKVKTADVLPADELNAIIDQLQNSPYFSEFRLNFSNNELIIGVNLRLDGENLYIKLYEPLPNYIVAKSQFFLVQKVSDSYTFEVTTDVVQEPVKYPYLKGPNFNIDTDVDLITPTEYLNYNALYNYSVTSSYHKLLTQISGSGIQVSVDYTDYTDFIHFSSAQERLDNFKYKLNLIQVYESSSNAAASSLAGSTFAVNTSTTYYDNLIANIVAKFDGYERYLYFESGAYAWPKSNLYPPYLNVDVDLAQSQAWYVTQSISASLYDELNESNLQYSIPEFIRQDDANVPYSLFLNMIGQHFDNIWIYIKAITDKYDADNRLKYGVSKDMVADVLRSFGVKLYNSNFSVSNLSSLLLGQWYDSGSEQITSFVTASNYPTPDQDILQETYKRIYHNLPYLIKTKGTERGLRALINCFGIPSGSLDIKVYGGVNQLDPNPYYASALASGSKLRLDNTGSIVPGDTLSLYTSIQKEDKKYTQDIHVIEAGFSPSYNIDNFIKNNITASFDIDQYIGDPRYLYSNNYENDTNGNLYKVAETLLSGSSAYDVVDFVRLIKFFDNQLFKMVRDFVPARDVVTSGIIIKPHVLNRSKVKSAELSYTQPEYTASIDTAFATGSAGGMMEEYSTTYTETVLTPEGTVYQLRDSQAEKFNGELGGTELIIYSSSLNPHNPYSEYNAPLLTFTLTQYLSSDTPSAGGDEVSEGGFLSQVISTGNMQYFWDYNKKGGYNYLKYIRFRTVSSNGVSLANVVRNIEKIVVGSTAYEFISKQIVGNVVLLTLADPGTGLSFNPAAYPTTPASTAVQLFPYISGNFDNSDFNPLINNATSIANSANLQKVDYSLNPFVPVNIAALRENNAEKAEVQEYLHNSAGIVRGRYVGKQLVAQEVNEYNNGDTSYGKTPVLESTTPYFCVFDYISGFSPEHNQADAIVISYIVDEEGNLLTPDAPQAQKILEQSFTENSVANISFKSSVVGGTEATLLGEQTILRGGARIEPILYSYTAATYLNPVFNINSKLQFLVDPSLQTYDVLATGSFQQPSTYVGDVTQITFPAQLKDDASYYTAGTSLFEVTADTKQPIKFSVTADFSGNGTEIIYNQRYYTSNVEVRIEQSTDGTFSPNTTTTIGSKTLQFNFPTSNYTTISTTLGNRSANSAVRVVVEPLDNNLDRLDIYNPIFRVISEQSGSTYVSASDNGQGFFFATGSGAANTVLTASLSLSGKYGNLFIGVSGSSTAGFNTVTQPFTVQVGDQIKFNNEENRSYLVTGVETPEQNQEETLYITLADKPSTAININFFALRRYVDTSNMVLIKVPRVAGTGVNGILYPKYPSTLLDKNFTDIISDLKTKGIL